MWSRAESKLSDKGVHLFYPAQVTHGIIIIDFRKKIILFFCSGRCIQRIYLFDNIVHLL